jgi:23S rRNA (adenine2030-N6)-methyltransferase
LGAPEALKTGEAQAGIERVEGWFKADDPYALVLAETRLRFGPGTYPGSPLVAALTLRPGDRITLAELHPREHEALDRSLGAFGARVERTDGLARAQAMAPPTPRRGLLLLDPSWEVKAEYETVPAAFEAVARRWAVGVLLMWYPLLPDARHAPMLARLARRFPDGVRHEVRFPPAREGHGMTGSGLFAVNPPWRIADRLAWLSARFATLG